MGCGASAPEVKSVDAPVDVKTTDGKGVTYVEQGTTRQEVAKESLEIAEADAVAAKAGNETFIASVLKARAECPEDAGVIRECVERLQAHNRRLKQYIAIYDCQTVKEAMDGGFLGLGVNDAKMIACLCTRSKSQLVRARKQYRELYDEDMRMCVTEGASGVVLTGAYARLMYFALAGAAEYIADFFDLALGGSEVAYDTGVNETALLECFVIHSQAELQAGKKVWEGRNDSSLIDRLNAKVSSSYRHLKRLLLLLLKGDRNESDEVDEALASTQVLQIHDECEKGWFEDFDESLIIETLGANTLAQNQRVATLYENAYNESLAHALKGKCGDRLHYCLVGLLLPKPDFIAMRLKAAMGSWTTDSKVGTTTRAHAPPTRCQTRSRGRWLCGLGCAVAARLCAHDRVCTWTCARECSTRLHLPVCTWTCARECSTRLHLPGHWAAPCVTPLCALLCALRQVLTRLLGGLDGEKMLGVVDAFEAKYSQPLWSALQAEVSGADFLKAALAWINALNEPARGCEAFTEVEVGGHADDSGKLCTMLDWLLIEHESLLVFIAYLDVETVREACKGWGTDDTALIRVLCTRSKRALARVNIGYREAYGEPLQVRRPFARTDQSE